MKCPDCANLMMDVIGHERLANLHLFKQLGGSEKLFFTVQLLAESNSKKL